MKGTDLRITSILPSMLKMRLTLSTCSGPMMVGKVGITSFSLSSLYLLLVHAFAGPILGELECHLFVGPDILGGLSIMTDFFWLRYHGNLLYQPLELFNGI